MTIGDLYSPAMQITDQAEADRYFNFLVSECKKESGKTDIECAVIQQQNLGYYAGYYDNETRRRVERLFHCAHPVFGPIETEGAPSPEKAFELGLAAGKGAKIERFEQPKKTVKQSKKKLSAFDLS